MARRGFRHVLVNDEDRLLGVISERDLFGLQRLSMQGLRKDIGRAESVDALAFAAREVRELGTAMLAQGVAAEQLTQFVSALNDAVTERAIELAMRSHDVAATGLCWMGLGSEGRGEQTLATDQDNAIIFPDREGEDREAAPAATPRLRRRGEPLARRLRLPAVQGQHHGAQPLLVPEPQGVDRPLRRLDPQLRPRGAPQRLDLLRLPRAPRRRRARRAPARVPAREREGPAGVPAPDGRRTPRRRARRWGSSATSWAGKGARST